MIAVSALVFGSLSASRIVDARMQSAPSSFDTVTLAGAAAKRAMTKAEINAETAERLVRACLAFAREHNGGASVVVLSPSGYLVNAYRTDGQTPNNIDSAFHKARTALYMRVSTREALNRWNTIESQLVRSEMQPLSEPRRLSDHRGRSVNRGDWRWRRPRRRAMRLHRADECAWTAAADGAGAAVRRCRQRASRGAAEAGISGAEIVTPTSPDRCR